MCWSLLGLVAVYLVARAFTTRPLSALTALLVGAEPAYAKSAAAIQADVPALALATAALAVALRPGRSRRRLVVVGALLGLALMVKLLVAPMVLVVLLAVVCSDSTLDTVRDRWTVVRDLAVVSLTGAAVVVVTGAGFWDHGRLWDQAVGFHVASQGLVDGVRSNIGTAFNAPGTCVFLLLGALAGVELVHRGRRDQLLPIAWLAATLGFLLLHSPLFTHHLVLAVPPAALLLVLELDARLAARPVLLHAALATLVAVCLVGSAVDDLAARPRRTPASSSTARSCPSSTISAASPRSSPPSFSARSTSRRATSARSTGAPSAASSTWAFAIPTPTASRTGWCSRPHRCARRRRRAARRGLELPRRRPSIVRRRLARAGALGHRIERHRGARLLRLPGGAGEEVQCALRLSHHALRLGRPLRDPRQDTGRRRPVHRRRHRRPHRVLAGAGALPEQALGLDGDPPRRRVRCGHRRLQRRRRLPPRAHQPREPARRAHPEDRPRRHRQLRHRPPRRRLQGGRPLSADPHAGACRRPARV